MKETTLDLRDEEVLRILYGTKTQLRRPVVPQPFLRTSGIAHIDGDFVWPDPKMPTSVQRISNSIAKPDGPDDWVSDHSSWRIDERIRCREGWGVHRSYKYWTDMGWEYDGEPVRGSLSRVEWSVSGPTDQEGVQHFLIRRADDVSDEDAHWRPAHHMPVRASRIFLRAIDVRIERLQSISRIDARAEGCSLPFSPGETRFHEGFDELRSQFAEYWNRITNKREFEWDRNPWVWVLEFERIE